MSVKKRRREETKEREEEKKRGLVRQGEHTSSSA